MSALEAINVEQSIIGSLIVDSSISYKLDELGEELFTVNMNKEIINIMKKLYKEKQTLDIPTIKTKLDEQSLEVKMSYLANMVSLSQSFAIDTHIKILKEKHKRRNIIKSCTRLFEGMGQGEDIDTCIYKFQSSIESILDKEETENDDIGTICADILNFLENNDKTGFRFGIKLLDYTIGGLFKGELTTIAAKSGIGKTALALQIMQNAIEQKKKVLFISREMSNQQVVMRKISKATGISSKKMKYKELEADDWQKIITSMEELNSSKLIHINDKISTVSGIKKRIRQIKPDLVIVDYLQLLNTEVYLQSREREVATLSRELKNITLDFDIPIIQLSQLNDEMKDSRPWGERPMRDSKAVFHDSNNVIYIHEPVGYDFEEALKNTKRDKESVLKARKHGIKLVDLIVAKCRDGECRLRHYCYNGPKLQFQEINY